MKLGISLALILAAAPYLAETAAGFTHLRDTSVADRPLSLSIWYPSEEQAWDTIGGNAVFEGATAASDAPVPEGTLPVVVVSHGGLRSATDSGAWLSSSIARAGYVVVEVNAPRPDNATTAVNEIWQRPQDIRRAIDLVLADEVWGPRIDESKVSVAGFALGATAALSVAGVKMDKARYLRSCAADSTAEGPDCRWYAAQGVDLSETSADGLAGLVPDLRVSSVIAVNPEYSVALSAVPAGVSALQISLGDPGQTSGDGEIAQAVVIPQASALDAFAVCTDAGPEILIEEEGDPSLCGVSTEARRAVHQEVSDMIISFLRIDRE
ncbi:alpha/beta hydrolase family protein [Paracoccus sp. T5]|uniref:alpha/beta hydrolase family protein n=1 Tax=Paracoccus sp. T5 TaxID=3402161 RepID=UPI003AE6D1ED